MKVLNFGSLNLDYVYSLDHIVMGGETISSTKMEVFCGGKGLNQSIALARAGIPVFHVGLIGESGESLLNACKESGVDTTYIKRVEGKSGHTIIQVDKNGQNCIILFGGSNQLQTKENIDEVLSNFDNGDMLLLQNEINLLDYIIDKAYEKGMMIALNPSPYDEKLDKCDLSKVSLFLLNEIEGEQITGKKEPEAIMDQIVKMYSNSKVVLTLGVDGVVYQDQTGKYKQEIFPVDVVDTTAAGDTFTGYFIAGLIKNMPIKKGLELAAKAASLAVSKEGATCSIPKIEEVIKSLEN